MGALDGRNAERIDRYRPDPRGPGGERATGYTADGHPIVAPPGRIRFDSHIYPESQCLYSERPLWPCGGTWRPRLKRNSRIGTRTNTSRSDWQSPASAAALGGRAQPVD